MITLTRTTSDNPDFKRLTQLFDDYLVDIDGDEKDFLPSITKFTWITSSCIMKTVSA
ncbi:MAG: hypothetical protein M0D53_08310 [Flavobacterium sp. JAD_PAG50586_2]|nr:MAG: hypothetical protein M0D53_08310 [Flavobacterium sp. JAD_PAG50586_2]